MKGLIAGTSVVSSGKKISNHSGRKTCITKLRDADIPDTSIIKITGHTTTKGLDSYDRQDEREFQRMSNALHGPVSEEAKSPSSTDVSSRPLPANTFEHYRDNVNMLQHHSTRPLPPPSTFEQYQFNMAVQQNGIDNLLNNPSFMPQFSFFPPASSYTATTTQQKQPKIYNNCIFINNNNSPPPAPRPEKRRRIRFLSDSSDEE